MLKKSNETEAIFTETEMNNKWNGYRLSIRTNSSGILLVKAPLKLLFCYSVEL